MLFEGARMLDAAYFRNVNFPSFNFRKFRDHCQKGMIFRTSLMVTLEIDRWCKVCYTYLSLCFHAEQPPAVDRLVLRKLV